MNKNKNFGFQDKGQTLLLSPARKITCPPALLPNSIFGRDISHWHKSWRLSSSRRPWKQKLEECLFLIWLYLQLLYLQLWAASSVNSVDKRQKIYQVVTGLQPDWVCSQVGEQYWVTSIMTQSFKSCFFCLWIKKFIYKEFILLMQSIKSRIIYPFFWVMSIRTYFNYFTGSLPTFKFIT